MTKVQTTLSVKINKDLEKGVVEIVSPSTNGAPIPVTLLVKLLEAMNKVEMEWNEQLRKG